MVPISSVGIPRVPTYSGYCSLFLNFAYGIVTLFDLPFIAVRLSSQIRLRSPYPARISTNGLGSSDFARHYSRNRFYFLFLRVLRCFSSPGSPHITMCSLYDNATLLALSSLIRISTDRRMFAPPRSFSQLATSFFGAIYQGILRVLFVAWSFYSSSLQKFYNFHSFLSTQFKVRLLVLHLKIVLTSACPSKHAFEFIALRTLFLLCSCQPSDFLRQKGFFVRKKQAVSKTAYT